jgi:hypothetical protein
VQRQHISGQDLAFKFDFKTGKLNHKLLTGYDLQKRGTKPKVAGKCRKRIIY